MVTRTQAIKNFLSMCGTPKDLAELYSADMECQVDVSKLNNQVLKDKEFRGKKYLAYQCSETGTIYKPFRIPWNSMKEDSSYEDSEMTFDLSKYAEGIGLTGWDWKNKNSVWVGFDFDSIVNHQKGLDREELTALYKAVYDLPYATIRTSTTGSGFHIYVFVQGANSKTHTEHQSLARSILNKMSLDTGLDLQAKVDQLGQILWVWAKKMTPEGLQLVKKGEVLTDIPLNWRDHIGSLGKRVMKNKPDIISDDELNDFNDLARRRLMTPLDDKHRRVIDELGKIGGFDTYWNSEHGMLITHTSALKEVHTKLALRGPFETATSGSSTKNCFAFPLEDGAWSIRRHGRGVTEASTWTRDSGDWTQCYYNRVPNFQTACKMHGGVEDKDGSYVFANAEMAAKAAREMEVLIDVDPTMSRRGARLLIHNKTERLIVEIDGDNKDAVLPGWIKKTKTHQFMSERPVTTVDKIETETSEETIRHCVTPEGADAGFFIRGIDGTWIDEPRMNVLSVLSHYGYSFKEREMEIGRLTQNYWTLISEPFSPEYPGGRKWNKGAAQLRWEKKADAHNLNYPTWMTLFNHLGRGLDEPVKNNKWCVENGIGTGGDYLKCWIAAIVQYPKQPLPYLFFYGKENTGKSTFHEAVDMIFTKGVVRIASALQNASHFNGEIEGAVLGIIEELNLSSKRDGPVINKIKDLVTSRRVSLHRKGETPFMMDNTLHIAQFSNDINAAPVFTGDTRIVVIPVYPLENEIPKMEMEMRLAQEAQDFTTELLNIELPKADGRLRIPVIVTEAKETLAESNISDIERFILESVYKRDGACVSVTDLWESFCGEYDVSHLTMHTFNKIITQQTGTLKGKYGSAKTMHWANLTLRPEEPATEPYTIVNGYLKKGV